MAINTAGSPPDASAMLDVSSTTQGMLIPRMSEAERELIGSPAEGLIIYITDCDCYNFYNGTNWMEWCGECIPPNPPMPGSNTPVCEGNTINLTANSVTGASYSWTGPNSFSSSLQNPTVSNVDSVNAGTYSVSITVNSCTSSAANTDVTVIGDPSAPAPITGDDCVDENEEDVEYWVNSVNGGLTYTWSVPSGATIASGQGDTLISVNFGTVSGDVCVQANGACVSSSQTCKAVAVGFVVYANANEAYWTEKDNGWRNIKIGANLYIWNSTDKIYTRASATIILVPDLASTEVTASTFYGYSGGGSASNSNFQWDEEQWPVGNRGVNYDETYDVDKLFVSPAAAAGRNLCEEYDNGFSGPCSGNITIADQVLYTTAPFSLIVAGSYDLCAYAHQGNVGVQRTGTNYPYIGQQSLLGNTYCVATYGKGWRLPTDLEAGHTANLVCHDGYKGTTAIYMSTTTNNSTTIPSRVWYLRLSDYNWSVSGCTFDTYDRCVYAGKRAGGYY
ncbi:MAG: immunoglobulin domain-containing protein [Bacteroidetes bacterium]|nr:immunoglobulin domain-containing protein [Bacteroidota bacterium]